MQITVQGANAVGSPLGNISAAENLITLAGITDPVKQTALRTYYTGLRDNGVWSLIDRLYIFPEATAAQQAWDFRYPVPANSLVWMADAPTAHTAAGYVGNGTTIYAKTGYLYQNINDSFCAALNSTPETGAGTSGATLTAGTSSVYPGNFVYLARKFKASNGNGTAVMQTSGTLEESSLSNSGQFRILTNAGASYDMNKTRMMAVSRKANNLQKLYDDGVVIGSNTHDSSTATAANQDMWIMTGNLKGVAGLFSASTVNCVCYGKGFTDAQVAAFNTLTKAYNTAIGR